MKIIKIVSCFLVLQLFLVVSAGVVQAEASANDVAINGMRIGILTDSPVVHYDEEEWYANEETFSVQECEGMEITTGFSIGALDEDLKMRLKAYLDGNLVFDRLQALTNNEEAFGSSYEFDFTLEKRLLSLGNHTFKTEFEVIEGNDIDASNNSMMKSFDVTSCEIDIPVSADAGEQVWGGLVTAYPYPQGSISGVNELVEGAIVEINNGEYQTTTNEDGYWFILLPEDQDYSVKVSKPGYSKRWFVLEAGDSYYTYAKLDNFSKSSWLPDVLGIDIQGDFNVSDIYGNVSESDWFAPYLKELLKDGYIRGDLVGSCPDCSIHLDGGEKLLRKDVILTLLRVKGDNYNDMYWDPEMPDIDVDSYFCDEKGSYMNGYLEQAVYMYEKGWVAGSPPSGDCSLPLLKAKDEINRVETLTFIYRVFDVDLPTGGNVDVSMFSDVSESDWFAPVLSQAYKDGIISGYPDGTFKPANVVNFVEFAKLYSEIKSVFAD